MSHSLDFTIRERLATYLANEISLEEFEDWFFPETWDIDEIDNLAIINLIYGIKLRLAEFSNHDWTEKELRSQLRPFIQQFAVTPSQSQVQYGTSSTSLEMSVSTTSSVSQSFDTVLLTVYG